MTNNKLKLVVFFLLLGVLAVSLSLVMQRQDTRRDAYFSTTEFNVMIDEEEVKQGDELIASLKINSQTKIHAFQTTVCYDKNIEFDKIVPYVAVGFKSQPVFLLEKEIANRSCIKFAVQGDTENQYKWSKNSVVASIYFKVVEEEGEGKIDIVNDETMLVGPDSNKLADHMVKIDNEDSFVSYKIVKDEEEPPKVLGDGLRFYYAFDGVIKDNSKCGMDWPIDIMVVDKEGNKFIVDNYKGKHVGNKKVNDMNLEYFVAELELGENIDLDDLAVFIKGPKHMQLKYGIDKQKDYYNTLYGQLKAFNLGDDEDKVYDFTAYPLLAGDIAGGKQDGFVDALDFAYVKKQLSVDNPDKSVDLDGNCKINSGDWALVLKTLKEKEDQNY
jgi:hypothetical protein